MRRRIYIWMGVVLLIAVTIIAIYVTCNKRLNTDITVSESSESSFDIDNFKLEIEDMICEIYAPETPEEFNETRNKWNGRMSLKAHKDLFGSHDIVELSEHDLERIVSMHYVAYGPAELQSDNIERALVEFSVINNVTYKCINICIEMLLSEEGYIFAVGIRTF